MEIEGFDIHEVNRLIQREQIPGFKMLPKEKAYLEKYRETLRTIYTGEKKKNDIQETATTADAEVEIEVKTKRSKRTNKKKTESVKSE